MKRTLLFLALLIVGFASCKKDDDNVSTPVKSAYYITGIVDRTMQKVVIGTTSPVSMNLNVVYEHSEQERVTLSVENLPAGLKAKFSSKSGVPTFATTLQLLDSGVVAGEYTLRLVATGALSGQKTYEFNLSVLDPADCSQDVVGNSYVTTGSCITGGAFTQDITSVAGQAGRIVFSNFDKTSAQVYGYVICNTGQITIPGQVVNGTTYQGSGSYSTSGTIRTINVSYTRIISGNQTSCNMQLKL